jgi:alpha-beta hydrolase superfamily lysophospholipase
MSAKSCPSPSGADVGGYSAATRTSGLWLSPPEQEPEFSAIAGWLTRPALRSDVGVVILPPAGYAYSSSHRFWRMLAETLAARGITTLRVDYPGTGDSGGAAESLQRLAPWRSVLPTAVAHLTQEEEVQHVVVVGAQLGALLALLDGPELGAAGIVAVAQPQSGRQLVRALKMIGIRAPEDLGGIAVGGYYFPDALLDEIRSLPAPQPADVPSFAVGLENDAVPEFMSRPSEDATFEPGLVLAVADWIDGLQIATPAGAGDARAATAVHHRGWPLFERFVTLGPDRLVGVLTTAAPVTTVPDDVYVLVNSGSDPHTGPGRAWVELARYLTTVGRATLRVDLRGWGESPDGPSVPGRPGDAHAVDDIARLVEALSENPRRRVVLGGLCSGSWSALAAARATDVAGLVVLNPPLYWQQGDPVEALIWDTRARRMPEILDIKRAAAEGRWDDEDERGIRPPAGEWLDDLVRQGRRAALIFTEGDDGLVYLQDRLARRVRSVTESGVIRVVEVPGADYVDQTMGRCWQRPVVFEAIAAELTWLLGPAAPAATSPVSLAPWSATTKPSGALTEV